ncbi:MAG: O-acetyl-ADP-ribose deacetylase [Nocardioidaceae bacterium]|nr:O-acetyl-ADP-ribose deacetylase [Nocardioidaceae bacterium]
MRLYVQRGDITSITVDAVINAASSRMRGGGGVDGAIHRAGGPAILRDCIARHPHGLRTGAAGWTTGGALPARWVIHVVGPNRNAGQDDPELLASCYRNALAVADELGARTLASPLVSAGIYGWPLDDAARIAVTTVGSTESAVTDVTFVAFGADAHRALDRALAELNA